MASVSLRLRLRSLVRKKFFTNCWVRVLPPWRNCPALALTQTARAMDFSETPWWDQKSRSSTATRVSTRYGGTSSSLMRMRSSLCEGYMPPISSGSMRATSSLEPSARDRPAT